VKNLIYNNPGAVSLFITILVALLMISLIIAIFISGRNCKLVDSEVFFGKVVKVYHCKNLTLDTNKEFAFCEEKGDIYECLKL